MIKIFQINSDKDINKVKFMPYKYVKEFDFSIYDEVWSGDVSNSKYDFKYNSLDRVYEIFNLYHPKDFKGHSLSISDVVQVINSDKRDNVEEGYYYCDSFGWEKLDEELIK